MILLPIQEWQDVSNVIRVHNAFYVINLITFHLMEMVDVYVLISMLLMELTVELALIFSIIVKIVLINQLVSLVNLVIS